MERPTRLELALKAWKAFVLPLHHGRNYYYASLTSFYIHPASSFKASLCKRSMPSFVSFKQGI